MKRECVVSINSIPRGDQSGVSHKVEMQASALASQYQSVISVRPSAKHRFLRLMACFFGGMKCLRQHPEADFVVRYDAYTAMLIPAIARRGRRVVVELNGKPTCEVAGPKKALQLRLDKSCLGRASVIAPVCDSVADYARAFCPTTQVSVVGNAAVVPSEFVRRKAGSPPTLLYVGTFQPFHGLDKLLTALADHRLREVNLVLVGSGPQEMCIRQLTTSLGLHNRVRFVGWVSPERLEQYVAVSDLGVGSLGLERVGLEDGASLKTRTYLAHGLPCFLGVVDKNVLRAQDFVFVLDEQDLPGAIAEALSKAREGGDRLRQEVWRYAEQHFSYQVWASKIASLMGQCKEA